MKLKPLKPSMKENKRYLSIKGQNLNQNIEKAIFDFIGILGMSKTGLNWIKKGKDSAIISINRESLDEVRASFGIFSEKISVENVSGTLKGLRGKKK